MIFMSPKTVKALFPSFLTFSFLYFVINLILSGYCFAGQTEENIITLESAVKTAIENNTDLFVSSKQVEISEGALQSASGAFDTSVSNSVSYVNSKKGLFSDDNDEYAGGKSAETNTSYNLNYTQKKRTGNTYNVSISSLQELDNKIPTEKKHNTGNVNISVTVPLARGKGAAAATAAEKSASASLGASRLDYSSDLAATVLKTVNAYWDYCVIYRKLEILKQAV
nr:TolC family protein [Candidatus Wallbacteria bacterium]